MLFSILGKLNSLWTLRSRSIIIGSIYRAVIIESPLIISCETHKVIWIYTWKVVLIILLLLLLSSYVLVIL